MNIVMIHPYVTVCDPEIYFSEPIGLLCLATYLKQELKGEVEVTVLDLYALGADKPKQRGDLYVIGIDDESEIQAMLAKLKPDLIGIHSNFTAYAMDALEIADISKRVLPDVPVVMGGAHPTIEAENILNNHISVNYVVRGEGELTLQELVCAIRDNTPVEAIAGLSYRSSSKDEIIKVDLVISNPGRKLIKDMDILPTPDRSYIDMERYKYLNKECLWYTRKDPIATINTSRGCPYDCVFCSTKVVWERRWRPMSLQKVFSEIEGLVSEYGVREIVINDDQFMTKKSRVHEFCDYFIERNLDLSFWYESGTSTWLVDEELLIKMRQAGFYAIRFPVETGSEETVKFINKPIDLDKAKNLIKTANRLGYWTSANFIIGFPNETREEIYETIDYAYDSVLDYAFFFIAKANSGSDLYDILKEKGLLLDPNLSRGSHYYNSDYDTATMTSDELNLIINEASSKWFKHKFVFYLNPKNIYYFLLPKLRTWEDARYFIKTVLKMFKKKILPVLQGS